MIKKMLVPCCATLFLCVPAIGQDAQGNAAALNQDSSVESFFQITKPTPADTSKKKSTRTVKHGVPVFHQAYKILWHTLDDLGVPMMFIRDQDLDPSISKDSAMPPLKAVTGKTVDKNSEEIPQKIPQSELEGTGDDTTTTHDASTP